ncbi:hypothetical protein BB559_005440 [Furculomyces boomerangus]|uniref:MYND-type domain-containing protein n=2 Tax=Harpellales TaxID=61421 RepID=A0A2T9Y8P0_9FUNG|nr:hypothetical protein BB559_005440 [Furculomyces boomerangus]PWA01087.1 hypothetical protein BB558_002826 [Smittium angustum]
MDETDSNPIAILGFAEEPEEPLPDLAFISKIGGKPNWLHYSKSMKAEDVTCKSCLKPMILLLQLYAPEDFPQEAFHRVFYVYICKNGKCHKGPFDECMVVYRSQLPEINEYYIEKDKIRTENDESDDDRNSDTESNISDFSEWVVNPEIKGPIKCVICGLQGTHKCGKCKKQYYCSKEHQVDDWVSGNHKAHCGTGEVEELKNYLFKEYEVLSEPEVIQVNDEQVEEGALISTKIDLEEEAEDSEVGVDKTFLEFQKQMESNPGQVLRYARNPDFKEDCSPLWVSESGKPYEKAVRKCELCGAERKFEFQIMPQMLNYLEVSSDLRDGIDWGTLLVYSCPENCETMGNIYAKEVIWRQQFSSDGIGDKYMKASLGLLDESDYNFGDIKI